MAKSFSGLSIAGLVIVAVASLSGASRAAENHVIVATDDITWSSNGQESTTNGDPLVVEVAKGDTIEVQVSAGIPHGIVTLDKPGNQNPALKPDLVIACGEEMREGAVLREIECGAASQFGKPFVGTLKLEVLDTFSADTNFWCVIHRGSMWGVLKVKQDAAGPASILPGKWTYRSFHNNPALITADPATAAQNALDLIFAEAVFTFETPSTTTLTGKIDWPGGGLDLQGTIQPGATDEAFTVDVIGTGRPGTGTADWEYDYRAHLAHPWPNGVDQVPALVGTVIRAKPHGGSPAGYVASFIAVKQPE
jgi:hypothetical protein